MTTMPKIIAPKIIAEVAQGYEGKPDYCDFYVRAAARAHAHAVKFQIVYADDVSEPGYQYYDWYKQLEMPQAAWQAARDLARELGIQFLVDVSGARALDMASTIEPDGIKFHSSNFFNRDLMRQALNMARHLFVSIGGITESEIAGLIAELELWNGTGRTTFLYGYQAEPTPVDMSCLARLPTLRSRFPEVSFGFLDHAPGDGPDNVHISLLAMAMGATWIEKHLTISRHMEVEDYVSALEPAEFTNYVATLKRLAD
ncbi:MAG: N-acetylneuraminate synthase family protein, partial [Alphaproteobacteria bacterium]